MVAFIQDDHIEEVMSHLAQPSIAAVGNLLNIGYHKVALKAVSHTSRRTIKNGCERTCGRWLDHSSGTPKTVCTGGIHRSINRFSNSDVGRDNQSTAFGDSERQDRYETSLAAAHWDLQ
jgi:hypothetical protein